MRAICADLRFARPASAGARHGRAGRRSSRSGPHAARARPLALARWLLAVAALVVLMVAVGGITRLTESGLSITEWKPVTGAMPAAERSAVAGRVRRLPADRRIPAGQRPGGHDAGRLQVHLLLGMAPPPARAADRARLRAAAGVVLAQARDPARATSRGCSALLALGGLQGVFGWYMVRSGLSGEVTDVSHFWLSIHLLTALLTLGGAGLDRARPASRSRATGGAARRG